MIFLTIFQANTHTCVRQMLLKLDATGKNFVIFDTFTNNLKKSIIYLNYNLNSVFIETTWFEEKLFAFNLTNHCLRYNENFA